MAGLVGVLAACAPPPPIDGGGYQLVYEDHFEDDALGGIWANAPFGGGLPATVDEGALTLTGTSDNDYRWGYVASTGPRVDGEPSYPFAQAWEEGYFEARIRYTDDPWAWPAFWLFSMAKTEAWPNEDCSRLTSEWDIMENGVQNGDGTRPASSWYFTALHRNTPDGTDDGYCGVLDEQRTYGRDFGDMDLSDWQTWSGRWTSDEVCTYVNGLELQCMEPYDSTSQPMHIVFTIQYLRRCDGCPPRPSNLEMEVDWVRVWQRR